MDKILQEKLFHDFPKIFVEKDLPMQQTCMCWGICTDDGWFELLYNLCRGLQWNTDKNEYPQVIATQVKEKFGTLRFYYMLDRLDRENGVEEDERINIRRYSEHDGAIRFAESLSAHICEICGAFNDTVAPMSRGGWYKTLCATCAMPLDYKREGV